ncbi:hypothetical protein [Hyphomonas sp.]|uniref:hypothetical protein n=1 Tax=Hyphomonas sp. TaxID=87 RepID=UPI00391DFF9F
MIRKLMHGLLGGFGALVIMAGSASAEDCTGSLRAEALGVSIRPLRTGTDMQAALSDMDGHVARCPQDPWINALGAEMDLRVHRQLVAGNNNQINQQAFDFLQRAFVRSNIYREAEAEARRDVLGIQTPHGRGDLKYEVAARTRASLIEVFMQLARAGQVHPYLKAETPMTCTGWIMSDTQTISRGMETAADLVFRPFMDAAAEACRGGSQTWDRLPLAVAAKAYTELVTKEAVTDPDTVRELLLKAQAYRDAYQRGGAHDIHYSKYNSDRLDSELRRRGIDPMAGRLARELWFAPEHLGSETMQFSLSWALSETWAAAAGQIAKGEITEPSGAVLYSRFVYEVLGEGREAGKEAETKAVLRRALADVQEYRVRALAMADHDLPPKYIYDVLMNTLVPAPAGGN